MIEGAQPPADVVVIEATPADVAALLRARTKDSGDHELGEWSEDTRPTLAQVQQLIDVARSLVRAPIGEIPEPCLEGAEAAVALLAAHLVEKSYFPEQVRTDRSAAENFWTLYLHAREGLAVCVLEHKPGGPGGVYDVDVSGDRWGWPFDWWQRNLEVPP